MYYGEENKYKKVFKLKPKLIKKNNEPHLPGLQSICGWNKMKRFSEK